jgi:sarcosine oxidase subunit gamma
MAEVRRLDPLGMLTLRGDLSDAAIRQAVQEVAGVAVPERLRIEGDSIRGAAWMAPDELLLFVPRAEGAEAQRRIAGALEGRHHLVADVSDLRVGLAIDGPEAREVLAKLSPADLHPDAFGPGAFRRTRFGQIAGACWWEGEGARVVCFRSVADYALALFRQSAADGAVGFF